MKQVKKLASVLLALVMVLTMTVTVFATEATGTIKVTNPQENVTYTAYKIFDVTYTSDDPKSYAYSIPADSQWLSVIADVNADTGVATSKIDGLEFKKAADGTSYVVTSDSGFSAASFAATLKSAVTSKDMEGGIPVSGTETTVSLGYYFVNNDNTVGALCNLTTTNPTANIKDKNDVPFEKTDDQDSVEVGQTVNYQIMGKVPDTTEYTSYIYKISDTMSSGLTFDGIDSITIYLSNDAVLSNDDTPMAVSYYEKSAKTNGFEINFKAKELDADKRSGKYIFITYTATVNADAVVSVEKNTATLEYSNNPSNSSETNTLTEEETVYSAKIVINKYKHGEESTKLANAEFVLSKTVEENGKDVVYYYQYGKNAITGKDEVTWTKNIGDALKKTTDNNGAAEFPGLKDGDYNLIETKAPDGYNKLEEPVSITVDGANSVKATDQTGLNNALIDTANIGNNTGGMLPTTGGVGTTLIYVLGTIFAIGAAVVLITKRRMNAEK